MYVLNHLLFLYAIKYQIPFPPNNKEIDIKHKNNENITDGLIGHRQSTVRNVRQICNSIERFSKVDIKLIVGHNT